MGVNFTKRADKMFRNSNSSACTLDTKFSVGTLHRCQGECGRLIGVSDEDLANIKFVNDGHFDCTCLQNTNCLKTRNRTNEERAIVRPALAHFKTD